jgi:hypothetical protein
MALGYLDISRDQERLAAALRVEPFLGAPARNIRRLASSKIRVIFKEGTLDELIQWLEAGVPVIAFIQSGELSYWQGEHFQHAVVIAGADETALTLFDPELTTESVVCSIDEFMLAWSELGYLYAVLTELTP